MARAIRRLEKEILQIKRDHQDLEILVPEDEDLQWKVKFSGPENSIYEGEKFT
jgi:ubiquitin-protein ligase